jgi:hypothetical protein
MWTSEAIIITPSDATGMKADSSQLKPYDVFPNDWPLAQDINF